MVVFGGKSTSAKTKLFEQPLDKLFSPKAIKQLNEAILASSPRFPLSSSLSAPLASTSLTWAKLSQDNSASRRRRTLARLRRFTIDANNSANIISSISMQQTRTATTQPHAQILAHTLPNHFKHDEIDNLTQQNSNLEQSPKQVDEEERARLLLNVLPEPIKRLLNELYLRGPETVGIFRKSPNAKHCKELRQKLEAADDQQNSIEQFQVTVIASVFKEWLRSLPDCLLMSRLYPQWIDVAKLIEPVYLERQHHEQQSNRNIDSQNAQNVTTATSSSSSSSSSSLESTTERSSASGDHQQSKPDRAELCRALSCSVMAATSDSPDQSASFLHDGNLSYPMTSLDATQTPVDRHKRPRDFKSVSSCQRMRSEDLSFQVKPESAVSRPPMTQLELCERQTECIRIMRQLLELLNEPNLILLRAIICVLWHIADNSEHNKMSSQNLGVCIGQSLLNDEHQSKKSHTSTSNLNSLRSTSNLGPASPSSGSASALKHFSSSTFAKRHRRTRSQGLLASTLSLTNLSHLSPSPPSANISSGTSSHPHNSSLNNCSSLMDSSGPQEAAKYVPILVAFMIDNAKALFGYDIVDLFGKKHPSKPIQNGSSDTLRQQDSCNRSRLGSSLASQRTVSSACTVPMLEPPDTQKRHKDIDANPKSDQLVASVAPLRVTITNQVGGEGEQKRPPTATQRLCLNSSDFVVRSSANLINKSTGAPDSAPNTKTHRRNLSMSVIVQISNIARDISRAAAVGESSEKLTAVPELHASPVRLSEPGTTTSILIENTPNTRKQLSAGGDRRRVNQSSASFTGASDDDEVDSCRRQPSESVSPICGSQSGCSIDSTHQQRPLSASESTGSSSRASSSTSGVHSESPAFSSETDTHHHRSGQATTRSSSISASISSPDPSSTNPSTCTSPVDMVDGSDMGSDYRLDSAKAMKRQHCNRRVSEIQLNDEKSLKSSGSESLAGNARMPPIPLDRTSRSGRLSSGERPKSMASLNDDELLVFREGARSLNFDDNLSTVRNEYERQQQQPPQSRDLVNFKGQQKAHNINYATQRSGSVQSQTLNRHSSVSSYQVTADRMPKIPFRYTTSCYGGEAVLFYPTCTHLAQQQQQHQRQQQEQQQQQHNRGVFQPHRVCARINSLDRHSQPWGQQHQLPQRSHVMMLRDYYLSLQAQNQQKQQSLMGHQYRRPAQMNFLQQRIQELQKDQHANSQQGVIVSRVQHIPSHNELARLQEQHLKGSKYGMQPGADNLLYSQKQQQQQRQKQDSTKTVPLTYQRDQPRSAAQSRANQFNGLYVKHVSGASHLVADVAVISAEKGIGAVGGCAGLIVRPLRNSDGSSGAHHGAATSMMAVSQSSLSQQSSKTSSTSSTEHSADDDESDDCSTGEWMESTMV